MKGNLKLCPISKLKNTINPCELSKNNTVSGSPLTHVQLYF